MRQTSSGEAPQSRRWDEPKWPNPGGGHPPGIGSHAGCRRDVSDEHPPRVAGQQVGDFAAMVDDGGGAGIRCPDHGAAELHGTKPTDVQVLRNRCRVTEPRDVAEVREQGGGLGRIAKTDGKFLAEQIFIADVRGDAVFLPPYTCKEINSHQKVPAIHDMPNKAANPAARRAPVPDGIRPASTVSDRIWAHQVVLPSTGLARE